MITLSTYITLARIVLVPGIVMAIISHAWLMAVILFIIAAFSDLLDGFLARYLNQTTTLGAYLDPIADKIFIVSCYIALAHAHAIPTALLPNWFIALVMSKEIVLVAGTLYCGLIARTVSVRPTMLGKGAMLLQTIFVLWLLLALLGGYNIGGVAMIIRNGVVGITVAALLHYGYIGYKGSTP